MGIAADSAPADAGSRNAAEQFAWLSWLKVLAIAAVVLVHTTGYNTTTPDAGDSLFGFVATVLNRSGMFAVPVFVMISGALMLVPSRYAGASAFLRKRMSRLIPAIIVWHVFYFLFRRLYLDQQVSLKEYAIWTLDGRAFQALYYFWIILGLALFVPILMPFIAQTRRRYIAVAGLGLALIGPLTAVTHSFRGATDLWVNTPWTWWMLYLGFFLLGAALRDVVVGPWGAAGAVAAGLTAFALIVWASYFAEVPELVARGAAGGYHSVFVLVFALAVFIGAHALIAHVRPLAALTRGRAQRVGRTLGDATLGVFVLHSALILIVVDTGVLGGELGADSPWKLVARYLVVLTLSFALVVLGRKVRGLKQVL